MLRSLGDIVDTALLEAYKTIKLRARLLTTTTNGDLCWEVLPIIWFKSTHFRELAMNVVDAIKTRRSVRKYQKDPIPDNDLKTILEAAQLAPSAGNKQPWKFIVVRDTEIKKKLAEMARKQHWIADAGVVIAALAMDKKDPTIYERWVERDVMTAVEHMVLAAWELGYGTCWIGAFEQADIKEILDVPESMTVINLLPIGVPDQKPEPRGRKPFKEIFFQETYGKPINL